MGRKVGILVKSTGSSEVVVNWYGMNEYKTGDSIQLINVCEGKDIRMGSRYRQTPPASHMFERYTKKLVEKGIPRHVITSITLPIPSTETAGMIAREAKRHAERHQLDLLICGRRVKPKKFGIFSPVLIADELTKTLSTPTYIVPLPSPE